MSRTPPGWGESATSNQILQLIKIDARREIVREVFRAYEQREEGSGLSFSELYSRVDCSDRGTFNYHLQELHGIFLDHVDDKYVPLKGRQKALFELLAWLEMDHEPQGPARTAHLCPRCNNPLSVTYEHLRLTLTCDNHDGLFPTVWAWLSPGCASEFTLEGLVDLMPHFIRERTGRILSGICPVCYAPIDLEPVLVRDEGRTVNKIDETTETHGRFMFGFGCQRCEVNFAVRLADIALHHPDGLSFLREHGLDPIGDPLVYALPTDETSHVDTGTIVSRDPVNLETSLTVDVVQRTFTIDESAKVIQIE